MNKEEVLKVIIKSAKIYEENLVNKNMLFLFSDKNKNNCFFETLFQPKHFHHLTGTILVGMDSKVYFYKKCLNRKISLNDFELNPDGTTILKMQVLPTLMKVHKMSNMIGDYNHFKPRLFTEKISGNTIGCMGFTKEGNFYVPSTVLKEDTRDMCTVANRLVAVYSKGIKDKLYNNLSYLAKKIDPYNIKMPKCIEAKIDVENLFIEFNK